MSERATALAEHFEQVYAELIATVEACSDADWQRPCSEEGWSVSVVAHHIASACGPISSFVQAIATGANLPQVTPEMIDANNAKHASTGSYRRDETLALLRQVSQQAAQGLRRLTDEQLDRTGSMPLTGGNPFSAAQMAEVALIGHPTQHLASIKAALGQAVA
jgi:uncharacterized damage-inducible protein DinB